MEKFPGYVYFCLDYLVVPISIIVFLFFLVGYVDFFYKYSGTMLLVGTTFLIIGFVPFVGYLWKYRGFLNRRYYKAEVRFETL